MGLSEDLQQECLSPAFLAMLNFSSALHTRHPDDLKAKMCTFKTVISELQHHSCIQLFSDLKICQHVEHGRNPSRDMLTTFTRTTT